MTEDEADSHAKALNVQAGEHGTEAFYVPVRLEDGTWDVRREEDPPKRRKWLGKVLEAWLES